MIKLDKQNISPADAKKRLAEEKGIVLLDVRRSEEFAVGHIEGSMLIPLGIIEKEAQLQLKDKNATIFVYCHSGRRSKIAADILVKQGYVNVLNLGGIIDWPYETVAI